MRKILSTLALTTLAILPLQADLQMTLMDKDGVQIKECIKSYSFSNNLESLAKQKGVAQDVYSEDEVLTNKIYLGKPVYRKVIKYTGLIIDSNYHHIYLSNLNIEEIINHSYKWGRTILEPLSGEWDVASDHILDFYTTDTGWGYAIGKDRINEFNGKVTVVIEYTKTTDVANTTPNTFKSYIHYIASSSTSDEVITKDLENKGVIFDKNYTYDSSTNSCTKN